MHLDVTKDELPKVDLIFCRDLFVHMSNDNIFKALRNFKRSGAQYLLTTVFVGKQRRSTNCQIQAVGDWRPIDLHKAPFNFPEAQILFNEYCSEGNGANDDKSLALWALKDVVIPD